MGNKRFDNGGQYYNQRDARKFAKRVSPKKSKANICSVCNVYPCDMDVHNQPQQKRDDRLVARHGGIGGGAAKDKKKTTPKLSKAEYVKQLKKKVKGISDADIKKSLKAAGYPISWLGKY